MCRWAAYRGNPIYLEELVSSPAHSLIEQSHCATRAKTATNGDGFGIAWYGDHAEPGRYRDILPAWSDCNLRSLARQIRSPLFLAHVRAATHGATRRDNCHPFVHGRWSFMHNGQISGFDRIRRRMEAMLCDELFHARTGATDSELLFLLALQLGLDRDPQGALARAIATVEGLSADLGGEVLVRFTAALSDGRSLYAVRYATDSRPPTLYAAPLGDPLSYCLVSEPLNDEVDRWAEIPDGSIVVVGEKGITVEPFLPEMPAQAA
ncbi:class II glutamine amidotransferase [Rhizobium halophilum]|uniref:class II glutamine amidotransferase n=1 Tax=Rhizobium halophilum TaxID=2846852 RepID=UPI001EFD36BF|nr:class II glutamine amidotransferase [Rhizobium halophilum]MCF6369355.1 class II glutamine amidotransferase [Rhizobium halophilum]